MATVEKPLVIITGPTASGKTGLAIKLAKKYGGEIICADSRTIYKGMDIGTAKPTISEREQVFHDLLDIVEPGERYTAADFQADAYNRISLLREKGRVPFLVGGTGLYIDAVAREYEWPEFDASDEMRVSLEAKSIAELHEMLKTQHLDIPSNNLNKRHLIGALLRQGNQGKARLLPRENILVVAIATDKDELESRIRNRAEKMFAEGVIDETKRLAQRYGWESEAMKSNSYPIVRRVIDGDITQQQAIELFVTKDRQLAKRQITWLKRHNYVRWLSLEDAEHYIETALDKMC